MKTGVPKVGGLVRVLPAEGMLDANVCPGIEGSVCLVMAVVTYDDGNVLVPQSEMIHWIDEIETAAMGSQIECCLLLTPQGTIHEFLFHEIATRWDQHGDPFAEDDEHYAI